MQQRKFSREFKLGAVRLVRERGAAVAQAARDLDVHENVLRKWVKEFAADPGHAFPGHGQMRREQLEIDDRAPKIMARAVDPHEHLVDMPPPVPNATHAADPPASDLRGEHRTKPVPPQPHRPWHRSMPRSNSRPSTLRRLSGNLTYMRTARRITSGEVLKRNKLAILAEVVVK